LKFNNFFISRFFGFFFKNGKKYFIIKLFNNIFKEIKQQVKSTISFSFLFFKLIFEIRTQMKIILIRRGKAEFLITNPLKDLRKISIPLKMLVKIDILKKSKLAKNEIDRVQIKFSQIYKKIYYWMTNSRILKKKVDIVFNTKIKYYIDAVENRMYTHYRWGY
jgi:hypothetical protein